jgi:MFS transporter, Spinster family, sphingosine-1-phosphate transporter
MRSAWLVVTLLMPVALLNYLDRQMIASMKTSVMESIPVLADSPNRDEKWGTMLGLFKWVYAVCSLLGGYVADRFSRRFTICGSLFVWSAVTWWTGRVSTYDELLIARALMGVSEAFYIPAALALIADYHLGETRSRAVGCHQLAIYLGVIAGGFGGYVADTPNFGWRFAFMACGIVGIAYSVPLVMFLRDHRQDTPREPVTTGAFYELIMNRSFVLLVLYFTLPAMAGWVVRDWMPSILKQEFNLGQGRAGVTATLYWQVAAIIGALVGGTLADKWMLRSERGRIFVSAIGMTIIVPAIFTLGNAPSLQVAILGLALFGWGWGFFDCNNMPILSQLVRPELRATGYGIMNFVSISFGGIADWWFGKLRDANVPINVSFSVFASFAIVSIVLVLLIRPHDHGKISSHDHG